MSDRRQRIAQLVAEHGQELVLGAVGLFGLRAQLLDALPRLDLLGHLGDDDDHAGGRVSIGWATRLK